VVQDFGPTAYGEAFADVYDDWYEAVSDGAATVARVRSLAGDGEVLELGVGTGRLALPLADTGVPTWGVDASAPMLRRLRAKPGGDRIRLVLADMAAPALAADPALGAQGRRRVSLADRNPHSSRIRPLARLSRGAAVCRKTRTPFSPWGRRVGDEGERA